MSEANPELNQLHGNPTTRILLIDDSKVMRRSAVKMLGQAFDVVVAEDGASGWEMIQQDSTIEVVFTDLNMPKMNGYQLLQTIRSSDDDGIRNLPVIVVTGAENDDEAKERALSDGATDFITKPFNSTDLRARAHSHADYQRTTKTLQQNAAKDTVTGLGNERMFMEQLERDYSFVMRHQEHLAILMIEVDDFNGLFLKIGRKAADSLLHQVGQVLLKNVRKEDALGRVGLAKFAVSLPATKEPGATILAQRVCQTIARFKAKLKGEVLPISVSIGVFIPPIKTQQEIGEIVQGAEDCLSKAMAQGGNQVVSHTWADATPSLVDLESVASAHPSVSIDQVLACLNSEGEAAVQAQIPLVLERLAPLFSILTTDQRAALRNQLLDG